MSGDLDPIRMVNEGAWIRVYDFQGTLHAECRVIDDSGVEPTYEKAEAPGA